MLLRRLVCSLPVLALAALPLILPAGPSAAQEAEAHIHFVAVGHDGLRLSSTDGNEWKHEATGKIGEIYRCVVHGNGRFVAVGSYGGSNIFAVAEDGKTWKTGTKDAKYVHFMRGLFFARGTFNALGGDPGSIGNAQSFLMESKDGLTWSDMFHFSGKTIVRRVATGNGIHVGVGDRGRLSMTADLREWKDTPNTKPIDTLVDVAFGKGAFVGVGLHGLRMTTTDGLTWTNRQLGEEGEHLNSIVWADNRFVATGPTVTYTSPDGTSWQRHDIKEGPLTMTYGGGVFVGSAWKGRILRSTDAIAWTQVHKGDHHVEALAYAP